MAENMVNAGLDSHSRLPNDVSKEQCASGCRAHVTAAAVVTILNELMGILFSIFSFPFGNTAASIIGH